MLCLITLLQGITIKVILGRILLSLQETLVDFQKELMAFKIKVISPLKFHVDISI